MNNQPSTQHLCKKCGNPHELEYQIQRNGTRHLVYRCTTTNKKWLKATEYLPFIDGLPIKSYSTSEKEGSKNEDWLPSGIVKGQEELF